MGSYRGIYRRINCENDQRNIGGKSFAFLGYGRQAGECVGDTRGREYPRTRGELRALSWAGKGVECGVARMRNRLIFGGTQMMLLFALAGALASSVVAFEATKETLENPQLQLAGKKTEMRRFYWGWFCFSLVVFVLGVTAYAWPEEVVWLKAAFAACVGILAGGLLGRKVKMQRIRRGYRRKREKSKRAA